MREISFVKRLKFNFNGSVTKRALVIGDADNDQNNELVCANLQGELAVFKDHNPDRFAYATDLGMVAACIVGDVINSGKNHVAAINTEGWLFLFEVPSSAANQMASEGLSDSSLHEGQSRNRRQSPDYNQAIKLQPFYDQRMPANCKELLLADLDGDGQNEIIIGLTDRVLRTYQWIKIGSDRGKFVGLCKWEFADQIGAVSLNASRHENCQDIIVAQPGGTYAKLECFDKKPTINSNSTSNSFNEQNVNNADEATQIQSGSPTSGDNIRTEYISKLTPEYHQLALSQMRNHHISTEVLGGIRDNKNPDSYSLIVIATLDGTLMLVNKDEILWSLQVDHQLFALAVLETRPDSPRVLAQSESTCTIVPNVDMNTARAICKPVTNTQYFVACAWNGKTYIIDEQRNYLRFKFEEAVSAFTAGNYYFDGSDHTALVYATFNNQIILYYDVILDHIRPMYLLNEILNNPEHSDLLHNLQKLAEKLSTPKESDKERQIHNLLQDILYSITDDEV